MVIENKVKKYSIKMDTSQNELYKKISCSVYEDVKHTIKNINVIDPTSKNTILTSQHNDLLSYFILPKLQRSIHNSVEKTLHLNVKLPRKKIVIYIEGNIGAGKTTLLNFLRSSENSIFDEPMDIYQKFHNFNPLDMLYNGQISQGIFSCYVFQLIWSKTIDRLKEGVFNFECRGPHSSMYIFNKKPENEGESFLTQLNLDIAKTFFESLKRNNVIIVPVYLQVSPEVAFNRMKKRNRSEEAMVKFEYIKELDSKHREMLFSDKLQKLGFEPVIVINAEKLTTLEIARDLMKKLDKYKGIL